MLSQAVVNKDSSADVNLLQMENDRLREELALTVQQVRPYSQVR